MGNLAPIAPASPASFTRALENLRSNWRSVRGADRKSMQLRPHSFIASFAPLERPFGGGDGETAGEGGGEGARHDLTTGFTSTGSPQLRLDMDFAEAMSRVVQPNRNKPDRFRRSAARRLRQC